MAGFLDIHIHVIKEKTHSFIGEDFDVEKFHGCIESCFASDFLIEAIGSLFFEFFLEIRRTEIVGCPFILYRDIGFCGLSCIKTLLCDFFLGVSRWSEDKGESKG